MTGQINKDDYYNAFEGNVITNYKIAEFIKSSTTPREPVFVWGDSPVIYALSDRLPPIKYVATYHIQDFSSAEETVLTLSKNKPHLIIVLPDSPENKALMQFVDKYYILIRTIDDAEIYLLPNENV